MAEQNQPLSIPDDIAPLSGEELDNLEDQAIAEARDIAGREDDATAEDAARIEALATLVQSIGTERSTRETAAAETRDRVAAALAVIDGDGGDGEETPDGGDGEEDAPDAEPPATTEEAPAEDDGDDVEEGDGGSQVQAVTRSQPQAASNGRGKSLVRSARRSGNPARRAANEHDQRFGKGVSLVASGGHRDIEAGTVLDLAGAAEAFIGRSAHYPQGTASQRGVRMQHSVAQVKRDFGGLHVENPDFESAFAAMQDLSRQGVARAKALVAAGGWCAPSDNIYTLPPLLASMDGILDTPTIGVGRGGINATLGPDFLDFIGAGFAQTETQAIAGTTKECVEVDCPDFTETRLDAVGFCIKAPLLTRAAFGELVQRWIEATMVGNAHMVNARRITAIQTALGGAVTMKNTTAFSHSLLTGLELLIESDRARRLISFNTPYEVKLPRWALPALRADFAGRNGIGLERVTDAMIDGHFADRNATVQYLYDYQSTRIGTTGCMVDFPDTVEALVYPAGTFVTGVADVVNLDTIYDTADLQTNVYTAAFVEDGVLVRRMGYGGCRASLAVSITGVTGPLTLAAHQVTDA